MNSPKLTPKKKSINNILKFYTKFKLMNPRKFSSSSQTIKTQPEINFFKENISFDLKQKKKIISLIKQIILLENKSLGIINIIFCTDYYLLEINKTYLKKKTLTDIITFDFCDNMIISGDIFISIDRIKENSLVFNIPFNHELVRIIIHGVLHLIGYKDKNLTQKKIMTKKEDIYLKLII